MNTSTQPAVRQVSMQSIEALSKLMRQSSTQDDQAFSLNDLTKLHKTRKNAIKTFNELSSMGAFYNIENKELKKQGDCFVLNSKVCAEILINNNSDEILGKQIFEYTTPAVSLFGTVNANQDIYKSVQNMVEMITGSDERLDKKNINVFEIVGQEPIMMSLVEEDDAIIIGDEFDILDDPEVALALEEAFSNIPASLFKIEGQESDDSTDTKEQAPKPKRKAYSKLVTTLVCDKIPMYRQVEL